MALEPMPASQAKTIFLTPAWARTSTLRRNLEAAVWTAASQSVGGLVLLASFRRR
jgi:hypothetical protein